MRTFGGVSCALVGLSSEVFAAETEDVGARPRIERASVASAQAGQSADDFELFARAQSTVRYFERALLPGPGGAIVSTERLLPFHQSLSLGASGVDSVLGKDSSEIQVAVYGQTVGGAPEDWQTATWDVSSAFVRQRVGSIGLSLGRQPVVGGAARYRRMDGGLVSAELPVGATVAAYGGWTVLPRWDQWYGYQHLGDAYETWSEAPRQEALEPNREDNWMAGARLGWERSGVGALGLSFHHQAEPATVVPEPGQPVTEGSIEGQSLGVSFAFTPIEQLLIAGDSIFSLEQQRFSDVRISGNWEAFRSGDTSLGVRGEFLHTVPSAFLSQASVLSVFSYGEVSEAGGEVSARLPLRLRVGFAGYAQLYNEGEPGMRLRLDARYLLDDADRLMLRLQAARVSLSDTGYFMVRAAAVYRLTEAVSLSADSYHYAYDEPVEGHDHSNFVALHLGYGDGTLWDTRIGASVAETPYAALDAQVLAQFTIDWDRRSL